LRRLWRRPGAALRAANIYAFDEDIFRKKKELLQA